MSLQLSFSAVEILHQGSSLSVEGPNDFMLSPNAIFCAGFCAVGQNAYSFAVWYAQTNGETQDATVVWMANRDYPVNGKGSKLSLLPNGNLALRDADESHVWSTNTISLSSVQLFLDNTGNLVLSETKGGGVVLWQSFDFPTDTLLPQQVFTRYVKLVSSRSESNKSSGFYSLFFDNDNVLRLLYDGPEVSGLYWPDPWLATWNAGRSTYNNSRVAVMDTLGNFSSSDHFSFLTSDYGTLIQRRLVLDHDGNIRVHSRRNGGEKWSITWQAKARPCRIHGLCGPNSLCSYHQNSSVNCSCLPGYKRKNDHDWSFGCEPKFSTLCNKTQSRFLHISHVELYGYDYGILKNYTLHQCQQLCLQLCHCKGIQYTYVFGSGTYTCYPKLQLRNAYRTPYFNADLYLKFPANSSYSFEGSTHEQSLDCSSSLSTMQLERAYMSHENGYVKFLLWFVGGLGAFEVLCIFVICFLMVRARERKYSGVDRRVYHLAMTGFRKFSYSELKQATKGFREEIGRGAGGVVFKGVLLDQRVAAVKRLKDANEGEEDFLAEVSSIGRLNHMNLIEMWGYCAEGKHRLLVYEYMEQGSLAQNMESDELDWTKRFNIALGTAKGLAYVHEECLEWILHCDVKPQNILLDSNYHPKVADFGLSKLRNRNDTSTYSSFSRIRGTRGYMAPEWVLNQRITSKVDVYSYGIVVLEMVTGKSVDGTDNGVVAWLKDKQKNGCGWVGEILKPNVKGVYEEDQIEGLLRVALQCVEEEKEKRPTMSQVVEMLIKCKREDDNLHHLS
ncbi:putative receptor protein kinase ZmPK1 [Vigna radiata var. radiata]|uniref:Receptor-like serine/threonine-protein kinase n=1 Tax=Vigna radiata var. radiata TaxID=3916 RepID=A0A1S3U039_VIGRR|nr:putative receptor protein kinase ZmPK1 [Vigna radiata var. radiata]